MSVSNDLRLAHTGAAEAGSSATAATPREGGAIRDGRAVEWAYYAAMAAPFGIDVVISGIFSWIFGLPGLFVQNVVVDAVALLLGLHLGARGLFRPVRQFLEARRPFSTIERPLTQLPLQSAVL